MKSEIVPNIKELTSLLGYGVGKLPSYLGLPSCSLQVLCYVGCSEGEAP